MDHVGVVLAAGCVARAPVAECVERRNQSPLVAALRAVPFRDAVRGGFRAAASGAMPLVCAQPSRGVSVRPLVQRGCAQTAYWRATRPRLCLARAGPRPARNTACLYIELKYKISIGY